MMEADTLGKVLAFSDGLVNIVRVACSLLAYLCVKCCPADTGGNVCPILLFLLPCTICLPSGLFLLAFKLYHCFPCPEESHLWLHFLLITPASPLHL